jgi:hypothetical protein
MSDTAVAEKPGGPSGADLQGGGDEARSEAARLMGSSKSDRKRAAAQENGQLGGRPKGTGQSEETKRKIAEAARQRWAKRRGETE